MTKQFVLNLTTLEIEEWKLSLFSYWLLVSTPASVARICLCSLVAECECRSRCEQHATTWICLVFLLCDEFHTHKNIGSQGLWGFKSTWWRYIGSQPSAVSSLDSPWCGMNLSWINATRLQRDFHLTTRVLVLIFKLDSCFRHKWPSSLIPQVYLR